MPNLNIFSDIGIQKKLITSMAGMLGLMPLAILPLYLGALIDLQGLSLQQAGLLTSINLLGCAAGVLVVSILKQGNRLIFLVASLSLAVIFDLLSVFASESWLSLFRFLSGVGGGLITGLSFQQLAKQRQPDQGFAILIMLQFLISSVLLYLMPGFQQQFGMDIFYYLLIGFAIVCNVCGFLTFNDEDASSSQRNRAKPRPSFVALVLIGISCFEIAAAGVWAFADRIGNLWGLVNSDIADALALSTLAGIPGSALVILIGVKLGRNRSIIAGSLLVIISLLPLLLSASTYSLYVIALFVFNFSWSYTIPYLQGMQAELDNSGSLAVLGMAVVLISIALGPYLFSIIITVDDFFKGITTCIGLFTLVALLSFPVARHLDKSS